MSHFDAAFAYMLGNEGPASVNNPTDRPTAFGITQNAWDSFPLNSVDFDAEDLLGVKVNPANWPGKGGSVANINLAQAKAFYRLFYWPPFVGITDQSLAIVAFDAAVLLGVPTAIEILQTSLNKNGAQLVVNGILDEATAKAANAAVFKLIIWSFIKGCTAHFAEIVAEDASQRKFLRTRLRRVTAYAELSNTSSPAL